MKLKHKLALQICEYHGLPQNKFDGIYLRMWHNYQEQGGFRLTDDGLMWMQEIGMKYFDIPIKNLQTTGITGNIILGLDRHLRAPYHLKLRRLRVFDENFSTQLMLYDGDITAFVEANS